MSDPTLGSASASVSTSTGLVTATQLYSPYGSVRYASGVLSTDYGFTHQRADATSGLDDYGARYYDPVAGQFTSADTTLAGGLNRYAYVAGNPETLVDPSGHLYANPRNTSWLLAMQQSQDQPHTSYGSLSAFITGLPQFFLGTDTLRQAFHTIFQDPKASAGDKWKAAGVGALTVGIDALTIATTFAGEPEVGADARSFDEGLLATTEVTDDAKAVVTTTTTDGLATDGLAGDAGGVAGDAGGGSTGGGAVGVDGGTDSVFVRLYRAVTGDELSDIQQFKQYRNASPRLHKYFSDDPNTAIKFGKRMENSGFGPMFLTSGKFPRSLLSQTIIKPIAEGQEVVIPNELLDQFKEGSIEFHGWVGNLDIPWFK